MCRLSDFGTTRSCDKMGSGARRRAHGLNGLAASLMISSLSILYLVKSTTGLIVTACITTNAARISQKFSIIVALHILVHDV